jgi:hypothetical protein
MAITATFTADFSQFSSEVKKAETQLDLFETSSATTSTAIEKLSTTTKQASSSASQITSAYRQFDGALSAAGINIGPAVKGIEDLAGAAGKTASQLGAVATAGLVVGTAMAAWNLGRQVAEWFNLDQAIGNATAKLLGFGDVAAQTKGAVDDALKLASERAGHLVTTMDEAVRVNTKWREDRLKGAKQESEALKDWKKANDEVLIAAQNHQRVLDTLNPQVVEAAKFALEHGVSQQKVATAYQLTASEIAAVVAVMKQEEAAAKAAQKASEEAAAAIKKANEEAAAAIKKHWDGVGAVIDRVFGVEALQAATTWVDAINTMGGSVNHLRSAELEELNQTMLEGIDALARSGQLTSQQSSEFAALAVQAQAALAALRPVVDVTEDLVKAQWDYVTALDEEARAQKRAADAAQQANQAKGTQAGLLPNAVIGRNGVALDMFGRPVVAGGGIAQLPVVNVSVDGNIIGTEAELARLIGNAMTGHYSKGGNRLPA